MPKQKDKADSQSSQDQLNSNDQTNEFKELIHARAVCTNKLTRFIEFISRIITSENIKQFQERLEIIQKEFVNFDKIQSRLEFIDPNEDQFRIETENLFYEAISKAKSALEVTTSVSSAANSASINSIQINSSTTEDDVKLPPINLPIFSGGYQHWQTFKSNFNSIIDSNTKYTKRKKLYYLRTCLKGEPLEIIENLELDDDNYEKALALLKRRYENKRVIVMNHLKALHELPLVSKESYVGLRQLIDKVSQHINALQKYEVPTEYWDLNIIYLILSKIDIVTKREWEQSLTTDELPTLKQLTDFLLKKCFTLESLDTSISSKLHENKFNSQQKYSNFTYKRNLQQNLAVSHTSIICPFCQNSHFIYQCSDFIKLSINDRYNEIRRLKLCSNCLRAGHSKYTCNSSKCKKCNLDHNTLLHHERPMITSNARAPQTELSHSRPSVDLTKRSNFAARETNREQVVSAPENAYSEPIMSQAFQTAQMLPNHTQVLLSTAKILIADKYGKFHECRAILDSGSQSNLITKQLCSRLQLKCQDFNIPIAGVNQHVTQITQKTDTKIKSRFNAFQASVMFFVLPSISDKVPLIKFDITNLGDTLNNCNLDIADPEFNTPQTIDILLGASIFYDLLGTGQIRLGRNKPVLQETIFGWIFTGSVSINLHLNNKLQCNFVRTITNEMLDQTLTKFWQIEDIPNKKHLTAEEQYCEEYFKQTTTRNSEGRFIVRLPFTENVDSVGNLSDIALKRFLSIENKIYRDVNLKEDYHGFMKEYENLNHMTKGSVFDKSHTNSRTLSLLPHHAVFKDSTTTKCRIVFDASAKMIGCKSLNECLRVGPVVQDDLFSIVLRLRLFRYVLNADIKMMFRQVLVHEQDREYQQILWRYDKSQPIQIYTLNTVTYGTACAPYLSTRCLLQLAEEYETLYPRTCKIIKNSFYMDDLLTSVNTIDEALQIYNEVTEILSSAGFILRKWSSNETSILEAILGERNNSDKLVQFHENKELKTLGLFWDSQSDTLSFKITVEDKVVQHTKRTILAIIAKIYDPLGLIGPATIKAKIIMQYLWQLKLGWDEPISENITNQFKDFLSQILLLNCIQIDRHVLSNDFQSVELHGFSDASNKAYGACVYMCSVNENGQRVSKLLCAKSKVAPLKGSHTLPRLELLAATLLARLVKVIVNALNVQFTKLRYYTDSTIVLSWLKIELPRLKVFVANRIAKISELTNVNDWKHVKSEINPADIISRGINPESLGDLKLWWHGPDFLVNSTYNENEFDLNVEETLLDLRTSVITLTCTQDFDLDIFDRYSTLTRLQRVIAYCLRFKEVTLHKKTISETLSVEELENALLVLIKIAQLQSFAQDISDIKSGKLRNSSRLLNLNPFLDQRGLIRVGGRLTNSELPYDQRHPIILSDKHQLTHLIITHAHIKNLHTGPQNLLGIIRLKLWPLNAKNLIKGIIRKCVKCFRIKPQPSNYLMGSLPNSRLIPARPFLRCGVDYAGPINVKENTARKSRIVKTYIAIFVCFVTRAVHIELASDMSTEGFLNVLKRFISRRGKPEEIFSDNGLNFVGAKNHFDELYKLLSNKCHAKNIENYLSPEKIHWSFIPPKSPHMGGLWEAAVRSTKFYLKRILGNAAISFEETYTLLTQIEACLNSRPISPISSDPNDYLPLTPAHFIIGDSLLATPQDDVTDVKINRLSRYKRLQQLYQQFWRRWYKEYLHQVQQRTKWKGSNQAAPQIGSLVVLIEDNLPPLRWSLGRIIQLHPGADNVTRVVSVRVPSGSVFRRPVTKICMLPVEDNFTEV